MATRACPSHLTYIRDSNCEIFSLNQFAAPADSIQAFANGAIGACLPSHNCRVEAYAANPKCCAIRDLILNPSKICSETIKNVHYSYQQPLRQSLIMIKDEMLIFCKPIRGSTSDLPSDGLSYFLDAPQVNAKDSNGDWIMTIPCRYLECGPMIESTT